MSEEQNYQITWVGLLKIKDRKILMTREKGKELFQLPGGGQEVNETNLETLVREVEEELGVRIENVSPYDDFVLPGRHEDVFIRFLIYTGDLVGDMKLGEDIEEIRWVDSSYVKEGIDVGNPTKLKLFPRLVEEDLID